MQIEVNNHRLTFNEKDQIWTARLLYLDYELWFGFDEKLFSENGSIDWDIVKEFVKHIIEKINSIQSIGIKAIEDFQKHVHIDDPFYVKEKGKFDADEINLVDFVKIVDTGHNGMENTRYYFKYDVVFFFETPHGFRPVPNYHYTVQFSNHHALTIIGVYNDIWSFYKED